MCWTLKDFSCWKYQHSADVLKWIKLFIRQKYALGRLRNQDIIIIQRFVYPQTHWDQHESTVRLCCLRFTRFFSLLFASLKTPFASLFARSEKNLLRPLACLRISRRFLRVLKFISVHSCSKRKKGRKMPPQTKIKKQREIPLGLILYFVKRIPCSMMVIGTILATFPASFGPAMSGVGWGAGFA